MERVKFKWSLSTLAIIMICTLSALFKKGEKAEVRRPAANPATQVAAPSASEDSTAVRVQILKWRNQEQAAALTRAAFPIVDGRMKLELKANIKKSCYPGDANAIQLDQKEMPAKKLLITLERMDKKGEPFSFEISNTLFREGKVSENISVPVTKEPVLYGLYVCQSTYSKTCREKTTRDINEIFTQHMNRKLLTLEDRSYFFQMVLVDTQGAAAFFRYPRGDEAFIQLGNYLHDRGLQADLLEEVKDVTHTLSSLPVHFSKTGMEVNLPLYDASTCARTVAEKP